MQEITNPLNIWHKTILENNPAGLYDILDEHNVVNGLAGCGCESSTTNSSAAGSLAIVALLGLTLIRRKRR